jgi:hypothetical protein
VKFEYEQETRYGKHCFTCFGTDAHSHDEVIAFVDEAACWVGEQGGGIRHHRYAILIDSDDLAFEFKMRWC